MAGAADERPLGHRGSRGRPGYRHREGGGLRRRTTLSEESDLDLHEPTPALDRPVVAYHQAARDRQTGGQHQSTSEGRLMDTFDLSRRLAAEALGTGILVATVVGSGIMAETLTKDVALALLCNTLPTGAILIVLITVLGPISGAHFNPAVTLVFAGKRELPINEAALYILAQIAGGIAGTIVAHLMFALPAIDFSMKVRTGAGQWLAEAVAAFGLVSTIL